MMNARESTTLEMLVRGCRGRFVASTADSIFLRGIEGQVKLGVVTGFACDGLVLRVF
jgi:hypothetical protein